MNADLMLHKELLLLEQYVGLPIESNVLVICTINEFDIPFDKST